MLLKIKKIYKDFEITVSDDVGAFIECSKRDGMLKQIFWTMNKIDEGLENIKIAKKSKKEPEVNPGKVNDPDVDGSWDEMMKELGD